MMSLRFACGWCLIAPGVRACMRETPSGLAMAGPEPRTLRRQPLTRRNKASDGKKRAESAGGEGISTTPSTEGPPLRAIGNDSKCPECHECPPCPVSYLRDKGPCEVTDVVLVTMVAVVIVLLVALMLTSLLRHRRKRAASADAAGTGSTPAAAAPGRRNRRRRFGSLWHRSIASIRGGSDQSMRPGRKWRKQSRWEDVSEREMAVSGIEDKRNQMGSGMRGTASKQDMSEESESPINATPAYGTVDRRGVISEMSVPTTTMTEATDSSGSSYGRSRRGTILPPPAQAGVMSGDDVGHRENIRRTSANVLESALYSDPNDHFLPEDSRRRVHPRRTLTGEGPSGLSPKHPPISHDSEVQELLRRMTGGRTSAVTREAEVRQSAVVPSDPEPSYPNSDA